MGARAHPDHELVQGGKDGARAWLVEGEVGSLSEQDGGYVEWNMGTCNTLGEDEAVAVGGAEAAAVQSPTKPQRRMQRPEGTGAAVVAGAGTGTTLAPAGAGAAVRTGAAPALVGAGAVAFQLEGTPRTHLPGFYFTAAAAAATEERRRALEAVLAIGWNIPQPRMEDALPVERFQAGGVVYSERHPRLTLCSDELSPTKSTMCCLSVHITKGVIWSMRWV